MNLTRAAFSVPLTVAALCNIGCGHDSKEAPSSHAHAANPPDHEAAAFHVGDRLTVEWKGKTYPAAVIAVVDRDHVKIHYEGYGASWDEVIGRDRIKGPAPEPLPAAAPASNPAAMGPDGLPETIPAPGSQPPSTAEWNAVVKEVRVAGSSALGCETKMVREWLRVSCRPKIGTTPLQVRTTHSGGQQVFSGMFGQTASVVVQVVRGRDYSAAYTFDAEGNRAEATLVVSWPSSAQRPTIRFQR